MIVGQKSDRKKSNMKNLQKKGLGIKSNKKQEEVTKILNI